MYNSLTILVRVLREGVFNGRDHKALPYALVGDVVEVAGGGYGDSLIADGWVTDDLSVGIPEPELLGGGDWGQEAGDEKRSRANVLEQEAEEVTLEKLTAAAELGQKGIGELAHTLAVVANSVPVDNSAADAGNGSRANVLEDALPVDDLSLIKGIGPKTAAQLVEHGWTTFDLLAEADVEEVASAAKVTVAKAQAWINEARELAG